MSAHEDDGKVYRELFHGMPEGVAVYELVYDDAGRPVDYVLVEANPAFSALSGIAAEGAVGQRATALCGTAEAPHLDVYAAVAHGGQPVRFTTRIPPLDRPVAVSAFSPRRGRFAIICAEVGGERARAASAATLEAAPEASPGEGRTAAAARPAAVEPEYGKERVALLTRVWRTVSEVNQLIVRESDRQHLLDETCRILVEVGGFRIAWVAKADFATGEARPVAWAGAGAESLLTAGIRCDDSPRGRGPLGTALRTGASAICHDVEREAHLAPCLEHAKERGFRSVAAYPLRVYGEVIGALAVYDQEPDAFGPEVVKLIDELAGDVSYALQALDETDRRRQAQEEQRQSEERFRTSVENMLDYFGIFAAVRADDGTIVDFTIEYVNAAVCAAGRRAREELVGSRLLDLLPALRNSDVFAEYCRVVETGEPLAKEAAIYADQHALRRLQMALDIRAVKLGDGFAAIWRDVTERKLADEGLARLAAIVNSTQDAIIGITTDGVITDWNPGAERLYGYTAAEAIGMPAVTLAPPDRTHEVPNVLERLARGESLRNFETVRVAKDGRLVEVSVTMSPIKDAGGRAVGASIVARDIGEGKQAERELRLSEARFRTLFESAPIGIMLSRDGAGLFVNQACVRMFGFTSAAEMLETPPLERVAPEYREELTKQMALQALGRAAPRSYEVAALRKDGTPLMVSIETRSIELPDGPATVAFAVDITDAKKAEEERLQLAREQAARQKVEALAAELTAANKELESFSYSVSHDLRAPLRAIDGFSRILLEEYDSQVPDEARRYLRIVRESAQQMGHLIDDLLTFSRLSRQPLTKQPLMPGQVARQALAALEAEQQGRQLELVVEDLPECQADLPLLRQVFVNLLSNALKFTRRCPVAKILVGSRQEGGKVVYFVKDNGVGFDMRYANKLFGVFQRLHPIEAYEGTGVGLAIVQRIIHRHGGRVWAEAVPGQGATFYFTLESGGSSGV